jgi:dinuclear metal center YbgI/SA1388 family protein
MATVASIVLSVEALAWPNLAEAWDNVGLVLGDPNAETASVLVTVDLTPEIAREAELMGAKMVIAYHPPLFKPVKRMLAGDLAYECLSRGISVYCPHTALDAAEGGTNDTMAKMLDLDAPVPIRPNAMFPKLGQGRIGRTRATRSALVSRVKESLGLSRLWVAGPYEEEPVENVAVCAGSGADLLPDVIARKADVFVTGELSHHHALLAVRAKLTVIMTGHSNTERMALYPLAQRLEERHPEVKFSVSTLDRDPYRVL